LRKEERELRNKGMTRSLYIPRSDMDFYLALRSMLKARGTEVSPFILFCIKYVVLNDGEDFFEDFKKHYSKIVEERLGEMFVKYKGKKMSLNDLIESELIKESGYLKI
jgi:hypothetical protein